MVMGVHTCALEFYQKLSRIGLNIQLVQDTHLLTTMLSTHNKNDCVVLLPIVVNRANYKQW